jgi:hypothetical protein
MSTITFDPDAPAGGSTAALLAWFKEWLSVSARVNAGIKWHGIHDEGTYLTAWRDYYLHTADPSVKSYAMDMLEKADAWLKRHLVHGYWRKQEVHHGVEHFVIFLTWIHELDPAEPMHARELRDASANILDTGSTKLKWYDPASNRFNSLYLGTKRVDYTKNLNIAEHLRLVRLAWFGLACGGNPGLAGVITSYSTEWASQVAGGAEIPLYLVEFTEADPAKRQPLQGMPRPSLEQRPGRSPRQPGGKFTLQMAPRACLSLCTRRPVTRCTSMRRNGSSAPSSTTWHPPTRIPSVILHGIYSRREDCKTCRES